MWAPYQLLIEIKPLGKIQEIKQNKEKLNKESVVYGEIREQGPCL